MDAALASRRVVADLGLKDIDVVVGDARWLPFRASTFDAAFSYSVLQHFFKQDALILTAIAEIGRVIRNDAEALVQMPNRWGLRSLQHQARRRFAKASGFEVRYWTPHELKAAFSERVGTAELEVDGFFGLGIQPADAWMLPPMSPGRDRSVRGAATGVSQSPSADVPRR